MSGLGLAHSKSSTHGRVLALIPQAFPEQHCWARPAREAGRQKNSTLCGQAVTPPAKWGDSLINNTRRGDVIAKKRQPARAHCRPRAMQTLGWQRCSHQEVQAWTEDFNGERQHTKLREWSSFTLRYSLLCLFSPNLDSTIPRNPKNKDCNGFKSQFWEACAHGTFQGLCGGAQWLMV